MTKKAVTDRRDGESIIEYRARHICDAAQQVFLQQGYDNANMEQVAAAAGVTKKTLYNHFGSKDELFTAVTLRLCDVLLLELHDLADPTSDSVQDELVRFCMGIVEKAPAAPGIDVFRLAINVAPRFPTLGATLRHSTLDRLDSALKSYLDQQVSAGRLAIEDTAFSARYLMGMVTALVFQALLGADISAHPAETRRYVTGAVTLFCSAYGSSPGLKPRP